MNPWRCPLLFVAATLHTSTIGGEISSTGGCLQSSTEAEAADIRDEGFARTTFRECSVWSRSTKGVASWGHFSAWLREQSEERVYQRLISIPYHAFKQHPSQLSSSFFTTLPIRQSRARRFDIACFISGCVT